MRMTLVTVRELISQDIEAVPLDFASLIIAKEDCANIDIGDYLSRLDRLGEAAKIRVGKVLGGHQIIAGFNRFFFQEEGFKGGLGNEQLPTNNHINDVLDNRIGAPLSLSILYMEVGRRAGIPLYGINLPGHFIVKYVDAHEEIFIDPFHKGAFLNKADCQEIVERVFGPSLPFKDEYLLMASKREILTRLMTHIKVHHTKTNNFETALKMTDYIIALNPQNSVETKERGFLYYQLECYNQALKDFQYYLNASPEAPDADLIQEYIYKLKDQVQIIQ
jgi:regulator of sirC expression with transglutaminase-like and TPR domain